MRTKLRTFMQSRLNRIAATGAGMSFLAIFALAYFGMSEHDVLRSVFLGVYVAVMWVMMSLSELRGK